MDTTTTLSPYNTDRAKLERILNTPLNYARQPIPYDMAILDAFSTAALIALYGVDWSEPWHRRMRRNLYNVINIENRRYLPRDAEGYCPLAYAVLAERPELIGGTLGSNKAPTPLKLSRLIFGKQFTIEQGRLSMQFVNAWDRGFISQNTLRLTIRDILANRERAS